MRADEVHPGAEWDRRELGGRARAHQPVHHLVEGAVAADRDDERGAVAGRPLGQLDQVAGPVGEERLALEPELGGAMRELGPALAGRAVARRGIDEEDGRSAQRGRS
jgi:hypothetical protein